MPRVPITVMGYRCERCSHEWIPKDVAREPAVCPKCKSPYWDRQRRRPASMLTYEDFRDKIRQTLKQSGPLTWTEIRTIAKLPEKFPNNTWVRRLEQDIALKRNKDGNGIFKWKLG
jgi:predicted Zn-ribbon and HTH transcriptional regulator